MKRLQFGIALVLTAATAAAFACFGDNFSSIHFHSGKPDFGIAPRRGVLRWVESDVRPQRAEINGSGSAGYTELREPEYGEDEARVANRKHWTRQAFASARNAHWKRARQIVRYVGKRFGWTGELRDWDLVLGRLMSLPPDQQAALKPAMKLYLDGIEQGISDKTGVSEETFAKLAALPNAGFLREHAEYQRASTVWMFADARKRYQDFLTAFPHSPKREDALIMVARSAILPTLAKDRSATEGNAAMAQLKREFPHSRFLRELPGLRARLLYVANDYAEAADAYLKIGNLDSVRIVIKEMESPDQDRFNAKLTAAHLRKLTRVSTFEAWAWSLTELRRLRDNATVRQARILASLLRADPELAADYLYYRLNHALDHKSDVKQLAEFAAEIVRAHPNAKFSPVVLTRLAEVEYRNGKYGRALDWANRSLSAKTTDRALYVRGASQHKQKKRAAAIRNFERLTREFPGSPLAHPANENLALLHEEMGQYDRALDCYFTLNRTAHRDPDRDQYETVYSEGYLEDIAYMVDVRMTTAQLAEYIRRHPRHERRDLLHYSLGIRYLRDENWNAAEREFRGLPFKVYAKFSAGRKDENNYNDKPSPEPLSVVRDLRNLQRKSAAARTGNARAQALYNYASYYSTHGTLLLYNAALWRGSRAFLFDFYWNDRAVSKQDELAVRRYMYQHEAFARSRAICKQIVRQHPNAPILPYVLFREAAATRRLSHFNQWWNTETDRAKFWQDAVRTMRRIARNYPKHPVAVHARKYAVVFENEQKELAWKPETKQTVAANRSEE